MFRVLALRKEDFSAAVAFQGRGRERAAGRLARTTSTVQGLGRACSGPTCPEDESARSADADFARGAVFTRRGSFVPLGAPTPTY